MKKSASFYEVRDMLLTHVQPIRKEKIKLDACGGRILGENVIAKENVPPFDRSPYDGYAFCAVDSKMASKENPITLKILEEIPAGGISHYGVTEGCAVKILTGAPIPEGADTVTPYEITEFTDKTVTIFKEYVSGSNIVRAGEDIKKGDILAESGTIIDAGLAGTLAGQNMEYPTVYAIPKIGIISTGSELLDIGSKPEIGKIYNSNQYTLSVAVQQLGCEAVVLGVVKDSAKQICQLIQKGLSTCDMVLLTGGVSVGDYDLTPEAMEMAGVQILQRGVDLKPGMACAFGVKDGKLVCGLSGNPASAITNFHAIVSPLIRKLSGCKEFIPTEMQVELLDAFKKKSRGTRLLRGKMEVVDGKVGVRISKEQGNVVLSSTIGNNIMLIVPSGSGPLDEGMKLKGFFI